MNRPPYSDVKKPANRSRAYDYHEWQVQEMNRQNQGKERAYPAIIDKSQHHDSNHDPATNLVHKGIEDHYLYLDSDIKETSSDITNGIIVFDIKKIMLDNTIDNVIEMEIGDFYIPEIELGENFPEYFFYNRMTLEFEELNSQSIRGLRPDSTRFRYHFEFNITPSGVSNYCTPLNRTFVFARPINHFDKLTCRFRAPTKRLLFPQDVFGFAPVLASNPAQITLNSAHGLTVGSTVTVFIRDFITPGSTANNIQPLVNSADGRLMTVIDATTLEFPAAAIAGFSFATLPAGDYTAARLTIGYRRIAFSIRFRSIRDQKTNGIVPTSGATFQ